MSADEISTGPEGEDERAGAAALASLRAELATPPRLRARIEAERARREAPRRRWAAPAGIAATAVAVAFALLLLPGGDPTTLDASQLAARPADGPAPAPVAGEPALLAGTIEGLAHPDWEPEFGWRATGSRSDDLDGRETGTVFYEKRGAELAYTIVSGKALERPEAAAVTTVDGVEFASFDADGANAVTWLRDGHTCVLVGEDVPRATLVELAAWKGDGAVGF
jgi:hypothetical protein